MNPKKHKICFFNSTKAWGGGEKWHFETSLKLFEKEWDIVVFTNKNSELYKRLSQTKIKVVPIKVGNLSFLNFFKIIKLKNEFRKENINTIIMNLSADVKFAGTAAKLAGVKNVVYRRGSAIPIKDNPLNRNIFRNIITNILANSEETKRTINQNNKYLFPKEKIKVIYNGIDLEKFDSHNSKQSFRNETDLANVCNDKQLSANREIIIGNAGRLEYQKNQRDLIYIAKFLKEQNIEFKIVIAGKGRLKKELIQLAKRKNVEDKIVFLDFVENIKSFMENIDIFALTSFWEGFGYVLVEAMACRKPVVAYNISSNPEIVNQNESGFLVDYPDVKTFAQKIKILIENQDLRTKFGEEGRKIVEEKFQFKNQVAAVENYLNELIM